jgi:polyferredoxin
MEKDIRQKIKEKYQTANEKKEVITQNIKEAHNAVRKRMFSYIAAGFGLVVGFAWNDAISSLIKEIFPGGAGSIWAKFIYALILTTVVGYILYYVEKALDRDTE